MIPRPPPDGVLHTESAPGHFWSTTNVSEALPGVVTPLAWSIWGPAMEIAVRRAFTRMGALERNRVTAVPRDPADRVVGIFYGRAALSVNLFCEMGSRLPGTSSEAIAEQILGRVPDELRHRRTMRRLPAIARRMPPAMVTARRNVIHGVAPVRAWWSDSLRRVEDLDLDLDGARRLLAEAATQFQECVITGGTGIFIAVQPAYDALTALIAKAGLEPEAANALMAGQGSHVETEIVHDMWELGRGTLTLEQFIARHGYHGPLEGELSSRVWREDPTPVQRLSKHYASLPDTEHPAHGAQQHLRHREDAERALMADLPLIQRPIARLVLKLAVRRIPLRGVAKAAFLQSLDVVRASARRVGSLLAAEGQLSDPDDVFYLTLSELTSTRPADLAATATERRALRETLQGYELPTNWEANPTPIPRDDDTARADESPEDHTTTFTGIGASGGVAEGVVRIVHDPADADIEPGEILVCKITDPSWVSIMYLSSALVADIGGKLSHAAVVARELGVPCVVGTGTCTKDLRDGDQVRVNGDTGAVELLARANPVA